MNLFRKINSLILSIISLCLISCQEGMEAAGHTNLDTAGIDGQAKDEKDPLVEKQKLIESSLLATSDNIEKLNLATSEIETVLGQLGLGDPMSNVLDLDIQEIAMGLISGLGSINELSGIFDQLLPKLDIPLNEVRNSFALIREQIEQLKNQLNPSLPLHQEILRNIETVENQMLNIEDDLNNKLTGLTAKVDFLVEKFDSLIQIQNLADLFQLLISNQLDFMKSTVLAFRQKLAEI